MLRLEKWYWRFSHATWELYEENHSAGWRLLLVDARNAFNPLNRVTAFWNSRIQWPRCSRFLLNIYGSYPSLILQGSTKSEALYSKEGQGDPLSMLMYASALMPLIQSLSNPTTWIQNWYANDSSCTAKLTDLCDWFWQALWPWSQVWISSRARKVYPYCWCEAEAKSVFQHLGIKVVNVYHFLGGFIGDQETTKQFLHNKITGWVNNLLKLSKAAESQPQVTAPSHSPKQLFLHCCPNPCSLSGPTYKESFLVVRKHLFPSGTLWTNISGLLFLKVPSMITKSSYSLFLHD